MPPTTAHVERIDRPSESTTQGEYELPSDPAVVTLFGALVSGALGVAAIVEGGSAVAVGTAAAGVAGVGVLGGALAVSGAIALGTVAAISVISPIARTQLSEASSVIGWITSPVGLGAFVASAAAGNSGDAAVRAAELGATAEAFMGVTGTMRDSIKDSVALAGLIQDETTVLDYLLDRLEYRDPFYSDNYSEDDGFEDNQTDAGDSSSDNESADESPEFEDPVEIEDPGDDSDYDWGDEDEGGGFDPGGLD